MTLKLWLQKELNDLSELKSQFEADAALLTQRIEELATTFERAAKEMTEQNTPEPEEPLNTPEPAPRRRRRGMGGELTLDD